MTDEEEQRIRERAYTIWEREGRPHGRDLDHRMRAEAEIAAERSGPDDVARDREPLTNARQAAEALFEPNRQVNTKREGATSDSARRPRVLPILPKPVDDEEFERPRSPKPQMTPKIAGAQFARIRTLVRYGMTARQVAEVYGVAVDEIERILRIA